MLVRAATRGDGVTGEDVTFIDPWPANVETMKANGLKVSLGYPYPGTDYHDIAKKMNLIDESKHFHNFLHDTKLKFSDEALEHADRLARLDAERAVRWREALRLRRSRVHSRWFRAASSG